MDRNRIIPCLWFDDQAEEAAAFYCSMLPEGQVGALSRYPESSDNPAGKPRGSVLTVEFEVGGQRFTALNGGPAFVINPSISFFIHAASKDEAARLFALTATDGEIWMPFGAYPWSDGYGWTQDRFGVSWQIITGRNEPDGPCIVPCLLFSGSGWGDAEKAARTYAALFPEGRILGLERYAAGEGPEGRLKHGRITVFGQALVLTDSHVDGDISFNEAVSLQVMCDDQDEVDRYWAALSSGGEEGVCGWVKDRFGVSWQIVSRDFARWLAGGNPAARDRAFQAMMTMRKPDVAALRAAFSGR